MTEMSPVTQTTAAKAPKAPTLPDAQTVTSVRHYTDRLFALHGLRPCAFARASS